MLFDEIDRDIDEPERYRAVESGDVSTDSVIRLRLSFLRLVYAYAYPQSVGLPNTS